MYIANINDFDKVIMWIKDSTSFRLFQRYFVGVNPAVCRSAINEPAPSNNSLIVLVMANRKSASVPFCSSDENRNNKFMFTTFVMDPPKTEDKISKPPTLDKDASTEDRKFQKQKVCSFGQS